MTKHILLAAIAAIMLASCDCKNKGKNNPAPPQKGTCGTYLTNEEIVADSNYCRENGLDAVALHCGKDEQTVVVECRPPKVD